MQEVVIEGELTLISNIAGETELTSCIEGEMEKVLERGAGVLQEKEVTYTPSTATQSDTVTPDDGYDGLSQVEVTVSAMSMGTAKTPTTTITANPSISVDGSGLITASASASQSITPTVTAGYVSAGTAGTVNVSGTATSQLSTQAGATITPTESEQTAVASGKYTTGAVKVAAIPSNYIGSAVPSGSLSVSGSTVTAASGFYPSAVSANVASGYLGATTVIAGQTASTHTYKVERQAATSGWYEASAVRNAGTVTLNNQRISATPTESAQTFTPTNSVSYITQVNVAAIPSTYVGSGVARNDSTDLTASGATVTAPAGYYANSASKTVASAVNTESGVEFEFETVSGQRMCKMTPWFVYTAGYINTGDYDGVDSLMLNAVPANTTITPTTSAQSIGDASYMMEGAVTVAAIPSEYIVPSGTVTLSSNTTGVDVSQYAFADVAVPWTWMGEEPTVVNSSFYSDSYLLGSTSYNGWAGSTTAKAIVASAAAGTFVASAMNEYEYLINWQMDVSCVLKSTATKKATPIREVGNVWQLITRRPNSVTNITNDNFNGNTAYTFFTAPYLQYWNTSGSSTYTWSNTYGIYGTVQTPTFSNSTSDSPTLTLKTPIWYARCSSTYFATGRVGDIDQTETTLKRTCKIYRVKKGTAPREIYEGLVNLINNPL